jgi:esterase/lipase superfamily enzyme
MIKRSGPWFSRNLNKEVGVARWGTSGQPVLLFPTCGGDAEECERFLMIKVLTPLIEAGRIRVYSCDSVSGPIWIDDAIKPAEKARWQSRFDAFLYRELVPLIRADAGDAKAEIITAGASIGAFNAVSTLCRHPDAFKLAIGMSGSYDLSGFMDGSYTYDFHVSSPQHFVPQLPPGEQLDLLRQRMVILAVGEGRYERPQNSWKLGQALGGKGVPNRVDFWGPEHDHDWMTWREQLPQYLDHHCP